MGSILELLEGGVGGDGVGHVLRPLWLEVVVSEAACEGRGKTSAAADALGLEFRLGGTYERLVKELFTLSTSQMATMPSVV